MALFPFPNPGRKKTVVVPPVMEPLSKAHKILGSTPLSIDSPPSNRDDASSAALSDDRSVTTVTSCDPDSDPADGCDDHPVGIAKSDNGWGDDSDTLPYPLRLGFDFADDDDAAAATSSSSILRKSRSSSTITSWYDKSKLPLSVSQQTSSSAMAKGPPLTTDSTPAAAAHVDARAMMKNKRKPAGLDLTGLVAAPRLVPKASSHHPQPANAAAAELVLGSDCVMESPSILSPITPTDRKPQQRRQSEQGQRPPRRATGPRQDASPWPPRPLNDALSALPTLYDHYEQMSIRRVMRQYSQPDLTQPRSDLAPAPARPHPKKQKRSQLARQGGRCLDWLHDTLPPSPHTTASHAKPLERSSPASDSARSVCSRQARATTASKTPDRSFGSADLRQTSVLLLSDSEGEDDADSVVPPGKDPAPASVSRPSNQENDAPLLAAARSGAPQEPSTECEMPATEAGKSRKRTSFALAHTYITIPSAGDMDDDWPSSLDTPRGANAPRSSIGDGPAGSPPRRASSASNYSACSTATGQSRRSTYSIREARAVTLTAARHPAPLAHPGPNDVRQQMLDWKPSFNRDSAASSADQLTPPLSPTSVDFYIRSAHSSVDGSDSHSRLMAVSRQEEMLLSALRQRQRAMRRSSLAELRESNEEERQGEAAEAAQEQGHGQDSKRASCSSQRRGSREQRARASPRTTAELASIDLDLPAEDGSSKRLERLSGGPVYQRWSAAAVVNPGSGGASNRNSAEAPDYEHTLEEVPFILDDAEPRPDLSDLRDWHAAATGWPAPQSDAALAPVPPPRRGSSQSGGSGSPTQLHPESFARLAGVTEESLGDGGDESEVPRPDSPISPEAFPAVPHDQRPRSKTARSSAAGPGPLAAGVEVRGWARLRLRGKTMDSA